MISRPSTAKPHVKWDHVDGPLLVCSNGHCHWLTWWERIALRFGWTTVARIDKSKTTTEGAIAAKCQRIEGSGEICGLTPPCPDCGSSLIDVAEGA